MAEEASSIIFNEPIARKSLTLFYLIDTSGSMSGDKIAQVNTVMEEVIPEIRDTGGSDSEIKMAVMTFDDEVAWMYDEPKPVEDITWTRLETGTLTCMGAAFEELNSKLSRNGFMKSASVSFAPVIFLMSDGWPNDAYKYALKIAVAIGTEADRQVLAEFTGDQETVVEANNGKALRRLIKEITVTSSQIGSKSSSLDGDGLITPEQADRQKQDELVKAIGESVKPEDIAQDDGW